MHVPVDAVQCKCMLTDAGAACLQNTILCALLQPDPETTSLFDDIMFMSEGTPFK